MPAVTEYESSQFGSKPAPLKTKGAAPGFLSCTPVDDCVLELAPPAKGSPGGCRSRSRAEKEPTSRPGRDKFRSAAAKEKCETEVSRAETWIEELAKRKVELRQFGKYCEEGTSARSSYENHPPGRS